MKNVLPCALAALSLLCGCSGFPEYRWTSRVPEEMRTVAVPTFENRTDSSELGPAVTKHVLREFQREGTFSIRRAGDAAVEVQGAIVKTRLGVAAADRAYGVRASEYRYSATAEVSIVDRRGGRVLQHARRYTASTTFLVNGDMLTGRRNAAERIAQDFARQIVDDVVSFPYNRPDAGKK